jgi:hypothetical protein
LPVWLLPGWVSRVWIEAWEATTPMESVRS